MTRGGPYSRPTRKNVEKIIKAIDNGEIRKNQPYSVREFAEKTGVPRSTLERVLCNDTSKEPNVGEQSGWSLWYHNYNYELWCQRPGYKLVKTCKEEPAIMVEGCRPGPLGLISWPISPRFKEWANRRPKILRRFGEYLLNRPTVLNIRRPVKDYISYLLVDSLLNQ